MGEILPWGWGFRGSAKHEIGNISDPKQLTKKVVLDILGAPKAVHLSAEHDTLRRTTPRGEKGAEDAVHRRWTVAIRVSPREQRSREVLRPSEEVPETLEQEEEASSLERQ